ncbi:MAG: hypothetical protein Unbinned834contig1000_37 [Prokaryotic dsDNA virus sp.]|nr:MAG: hypothetical protein Unbinned834contig1000_37 [Prokaryotic dsDNA virus sp.]|tara:strand:- start:34428 stop:34877 length:450 start_codon:yes stop_codon:yes gene_type:complete
MGFTNLTFTAGQKLTSTIMAQFDQNFDALAEGDESGPRVPRPKVWGHFCGFSTANRGIYATKGLSSFTRNATGAYTVGFTTPFSETNNVGICLGFEHNTSMAGDTYVRMANVSSFSTTEVTFRNRKTSTSANSDDDCNAIFIAFWEYTT